MDIYKYSINTNNKLACTKMEGYRDAEKTYVRDKYPRRISKEYIGRVVDGRVGHDLYLLQRDDAKAREIFTEYYHGMVQAAKDKCQEEIAGDAKSS